jgi:hypothetical protein
MIPLLLFLLAQSPPQKCILNCFSGAEGTWRGKICWYEEKPKCIRTSECIESEEVMCKPWAKNLGSWDPVILYKYYY